MDKLITAERAPETTLRSKQAKYQQQSSALDSLKTQLTDLQTSIKALTNSNSVYESRTATLASASSWSATAAAGGDTGTFQIDVTQLATKAQRTGAGNVGGSLSATSDVSGLTIGTLGIATAIKAGDFTVNGARITVAATDSLQDVFNQISSKTGGVVTASYDPTSDKVQLSSASEIVLGSANDSSNFLSALQLFNNGTGTVLAPKALGVVSVSTAVKNANLRAPISAVDGSGNGTFSVNGVSIAYNINTDSIQGIIAKINTSIAGVTATFDKANDRFLLTNKTTGDLGLVVSEAPGGLLGAMGLTSTSTLNHGKNAQFTVNGGSVQTSTSNTLDQTATGIAGLNLTVNTETSEAITIGTDHGAVKANLNDFIAKFNAVQTFVSNSTQITTTASGGVSTSVLAANHEVTELGNGLRRLVFGTVPGLAGAVQRLQSLGIDFKSGTSQLTVKDAAALETALSSNAADVKTLLSDGTNGLVTKLDAYLTQTLGSTGVIATQTQNLTKQTSSIDDQVTAMERRIKSEQARLEASFVQMERVQSGLQSQLSALTNAFGGSSSK